MSDKKKYILIASMAIVVLLAITFLPMLFGDDSEEAPKPEPTPISSQPVTITTIHDLDKLSENIPDNRIQLIEENLYDTLEFNVSGGVTSVTDAVIRENSYQQTLSDPAKQIFFTTFIVDIPSLEQSYRVNDYYSPLPADVSGLFDYATLVLCLDQKDLIYGEFDCWDRTRAEGAGL